MVLGVHKPHLVVDAVHQVPLGGYVTTANHTDSPELPKLLDHVQKAHQWINPQFVMADRGYDSRANHEDIIGRGAALIAPMRRRPKGKGGGLYGDIFTKDGTPACVGMALMECVRSDPREGTSLSLSQSGI